MDQFYTNLDIAEKCYELLNKYIDVSIYDKILEPSAGKGSFFNLLPEMKREGIDLDPKCKDVKKMNFFDYSYDNNLKYLVIGNPPFGRVSSIAIKFFNKAAEFADVIAFIIPRTFMKTSIHNKLDLNFELIYNEILPLEPCCFTPKMNAKCCFQIWKKTNTPRKIIKLELTHSDFEFISFGPKDINNQPTVPKNYDFAILAYGGKCGKIKIGDLSKLRPKSWHWIKSNIDIKELIKRFNTLDYSDCENTVRQNSIGKAEIIQLYKNKYN
jgi:hypothetical protein